MPKPYAHIDLFSENEYIGTFKSETLAKYFDSTPEGIMRSVRGEHKLHNHYHLIRSNKPFSNPEILEKLLSQTTDNKKVKVFKNNKGSICSSGRTFKLYDWD